MTKTVNAWAVLIEADGRLSTKLRTYARARRLVGYVNQRYGRGTARAVAFGRVSLRPGLRLLGGRPVPVSAPRETDPLVLAVRR